MLVIRDRECHPVPECELLDHSDRVGGEHVSDTHEPAAHLLIHPRLITDERVEPLYAPRSRPAYSAAPPGSESAREV